MSFGFGVGDFIAVLDKAKLYRERFREAPDHFDSLRREIASLTSILEYIGRLEAQLTENEKEALAAPIKESTKLLGELDNIYNDNTILETHEDMNKLPKLKPRTVWRRLRMKPEDVQKLRQRITMNAHFLSAIKGFRDSETIHTTKQVVTSMHDEQISRQEREILDWLTTIDFAPQQRDHLSRRYTGTNQWLLDSEQYKSFLLAKLLVDSLACKTTPKAIRNALATASAEDNTYSYFYEEALERIRVQPPSHVQLANQVLSWIVFAMRPLRMNELQHALAVEEDESEIDEDNIPSAEIMISACAGLVTLDEQGGTIRLVHQTTQEFFSSRKHDLFRDVDAQIAVTCFFTGVNTLAVAVQFQIMSLDYSKTEKCFSF
ncbi:Vegetative incompatibility protein HET-E-1 [Colletotrichum sp. SAR 10_76]|nr:Vegetative incompatibility protein HET-E-1 [Colletotrichum sp. SAR 10_76]